MSGNPISIQHQRHAPLLSEGTLQGPGTHRTSHRQTQALQTYRASMREDGAELRLIRRACSRLHLDQIRPHGLEHVTPEQGEEYLAVIEEQSPAFFDQFERFKINDLVGTPITHSYSRI